MERLNPRKPGVEQPQTPSCPCCHLNCPVACFVFGRWREVGKAARWEQHWGLSQPFAWEGALGESAGQSSGVVVARAPRSLVCCGFCQQKSWLWSFPRDVNSLVQGLVKEPQRAGKESNQAKSSQWLLWTPNREINKEQFVRAVMWRWKCLISTC